VYTENGKYSLNDEIYIHDNGNYTITVYYNGNKRYSPSFNETTLKIKIEDRPTTLSLNTKENIYLNEDMNITGRLIDKNGYGIGYQTINISIGDYKFSTTTNMTGNYNLTIKSQNITLIKDRNIELYKNSNIKIIANYTGKWNYANSSNITHVTFYNYTAQDIKNAIISIQSPKNIDTGKTTTINLTITDKNTKKVINGTALIKINGLSIKDINTNTSTIPIKNGKGTLTLSLANYSGKEYTLTAIFAKTGYNRAEKTTKMTVNKGTYKTFTIKLNGTSEQKIRIRQTLTDTNGNKIYGNTQVAIKLGDRTVKTLTVSNSLLDTEITVPYLPPGENKFKITLGENYRYKTKIINSTINITKQDIIVNITPIKAKSGNTVTLKATLTNKNTKTPVISGKYIFRVNGKTVPYITKSYEEIYTTKNVTKGVAQWEYTIPNDMNPGKYIITLNYNGNTQSNPIKYTEKLLTII
ncbi:MAG: hypothetical protein IKF79_07860, partial [Methanosphaera sp.]|nr:hypothetical protein [Methanosphaera sp.]